MLEEQKQAKRVKLLITTWKRGKRKKRRRVPPVLGDKSVSLTDGHGIISLGREVADGIDGKTEALRGRRGKN